jgi:hypothetical protein
MENGVDIPRLARWLRDPGVPMPVRPRRVLVLALGSLLLMSGCGPGGHTGPGPSSLVVGRRAAPLSRAQLAAAAATAWRFAAAYARLAYERRPPALPDAIPSVNRAVREAAARVPTDRRRLRPRISGLELRLEGREVLASLRITDGTSRPFEVGFRLRDSRAGWRVVSISLPG